MLQVVLVRHSIGERVSWEELLQSIWIIFSSFVSL